VLFTSNLSHCLKHQHPTQFSNKYKPFSLDAPNLAEDTVILLWLTLVIVQVLVVAVVVVLEAVVFSVAVTVLRYIFIPPHDPVSIINALFNSFQNMFRSDIQPTIELIQSIIVIY
jgi:uncharacterized membrane protein